MPFSTSVTVAAAFVSYVALTMSSRSMTYYYCPPEASLLAPCVCGKNQNSLKVSQIINSSVKYSCASHNADITSAQAIFAGYCNQLAGTTSFPTPSNPPGDSTKICDSEHHNMLM